MQKGNLARPTASKPHSYDERVSTGAKDQREKREGSQSNKEKVIMKLITRNNR